MRRRLLPALLALLALAAGLSPPVPQPAHAQATGSIGIRLLDAPTERADDPRARQYIVDHLAPGTTINRRVEVSNDTDAPQTIQLYAAAASVDAGDFRFGDGRAESELTTWTSVEPAVATPRPGGRAVATVRIAVPADASPGERYGVVWAEVASAPPEGGGVTAVNRVGVRIYLSVGPGGEPASNFEVDTLTARRDPSGQAVVSALVHNTGGRALDMSGSLGLAEGPGGLRAGPFPATLGTTLGVGQTQPVEVQLSGEIPDGPWQATITLKSGLLERSASAQIRFPAQAGSSATPVRASSGDGDGDGGVGDVPMVAVYAGAGLLGLLVAWFLLFPLGRRRRRERSRRRRSGLPV